MGVVTVIIAPFPRSLSQTGKLPVGRASLGSVCLMSNASATLGLVLFGVVVDVVKLAVSSESCVLYSHPVSLCGVAHVRVRDTRDLPLTSCANAFSWSLGFPCSAA